MNNGILLTGERGTEPFQAGDAMAEAVHRLLVQSEQEGDKENSRKFRRLLDKAQSGRLYLAFCGHFSAGKSSLINRLCGHPSLPSSPIPTSANIVSIVNGESGARVIYRQAEGEEEERSERVPLKDLAEHCRNGEAIETVEISYPIAFLGEHGALLDTPGIDSTDDAHQLATESAMHLADVVFYVMDYNHVQSELNLAFAKKMIEWGKPLYLIVNMVDKHREQELSFAAYREGVREAFANWHAVPDGILFTSVKRPDDPNSEWNKLDWSLQQLIGQREALIRLSLEKSARALARRMPPRWPSAGSRPRRRCAPGWRTTRDSSRRRSSPRRRKRSWRGWRSRRTSRRRRRARKRRQCWKPPM
ncbi:dynamin family protein [Paenibacillus sp. P26]|nr:dynamin family protein [Paenibacillus sp. P26]